MSQNTEIVSPIDSPLILQRQNAKYFHYSSRKRSRANSPDRETSTISISDTESLSRNEESDKINSVGIQCETIYYSPYFLSLRANKIAERVEYVKTEYTTWKLIDNGFMDIILIDNPTDFVEVYRNPRTGLYELFPPSIEIMQILPLEFNTYTTTAKLQKFPSYHFGYNIWYCKIHTYVKAQYNYMT